MITPTLVKIALAEVGTEEVNGSNCGPRVNLYKAATNLPPKEAWPWSAAFVCWCVRKTMEVEGVKETKTFKRPTTAGAFDFKNWALQQDATTNTKSPHRNDIQAGDIVIFTFSHIGIATGSPAADGTVPTVEGNTDLAGSRAGGGVYRKRRDVSKIATRIRFTV